MVFSGPAPRNVTLLLPEKSIPPVRLYVPAFRNTTCPFGQEAMALLIWDAVAPGLRVAQMVARFGMPPGMPAFDQFMARLDERMPDQAWAWATPGTINSRMGKNKSQHLPLTLPPRRPNEYGASFVVRVRVEPVRSVHSM